MRSEILGQWSNLIFASGEAMYKQAAILHVSSFHPLLISILSIYRKINLNSAEVKVYSLFLL
jgi:hypothetical protein